MKALIQINSTPQAVDAAVVTLNDAEKRASELKKQEQSIARERKEIEAQIEAAKAAIKDFMLNQGLAELEGSLVKYTLSKSAPKLIIEDDEVIPDIFKVSTITINVRKDAIKDQLKLGDNIPGCHLEDVFALKVGVK